METWKQAETWRTRGLIAMYAGKGKAAGLAFGNRLLVLAGLALPESAGDEYAAALVGKGEVRP
jgi:hypothetical protein